MKKQKVSIFLLGLFSIGVILSILLVAIFIDRSSFVSAYTLRAYVEDATGLVEKTSVTINGVNVGEISSIELTDKKILLTFRIEKGVLIRNTDELRIIPVGLLGGVGVQIHTKYDKDSRILKDGDFIEKVQSRIDIGSVINSLSTLLSSGKSTGSNIESLSNSIQDLVDNQKLLEKITEIIGNIESVTRDLSVFSANIAGLQEESFSSIEAIITSIKETSLVLQDIVVSQKGPDSDLSQSLERLNLSMEYFESIMRRVSTSEGSVFKFIENPELYDNLNQAVANINEFTQDTVGLNTEVNYDFRTIVNETQNDAPVRFKNKFNLNIKPENASRYYVVGISTGLPNASHGYPVLGNSDLKLNAQIAQRLGSQFVLKGGLFENSAGLGLSYIPLNWLKISTEAYDFGRNSGAYLNASAELYPFFDPQDTSNPLRWLSIALGADDILNSYSRGYFVSIGLTFRDKFVRDVISLVPLAGTASRLQ